MPASESSQKNEEELYCVHTWLHWVQIQMFVCFFSFQLLCKSFTTKSSGEATQINLQKSNTLIWTFLSLCKELQSLCWSSGKQSCSRSGENYCDGTDHRLRQPQETHFAYPFVRIYFETSICSDHILSHYISTLLPQQCIVGKFNSRCYPCWLWALVRRSSLPWKRHRGRRGCQAASRWGSVEWPESGNMSHQICLKICLIKVIWGTKYVSSG